MWKNYLSATMRLGPQFVQTECILSVLEETSELENMVLVFMEQLLSMSVGRAKILHPLSRQ